MIGSSARPRSPEHSGVVLPIASSTDAAPRM